MLLAGGILNNGFTDCDTVGKEGDGIMGIYCASYTTTRKKSKVHKTFCQKWKQWSKMWPEREIKRQKPTTFFQISQRCADYSLSNKNLQWKYMWLEKFCRHEVGLFCLEYGWVGQNIRMNTKTQRFPLKHRTDCCEWALFLRRERLVYSNALQSLRFNSWV